MDVSALTHTDLSVPKAWGLAIQQHPVDFDGLRYRSRFDNQPCIALFKRAPLVAQLREILVGDLAAAAEADAFITQHTLSLI